MQSWHLEEQPLRQQPIKTECDTTPKYPKES